MKDEIAQFLLSKGYYLTALEFYQELLEDDGTELESLRDYFIKNINTGGDPIRIIKDRKKNESSSSSSKVLSNHEIETIKVKDDKISLLEYELRQARDDITKLKNQLKQNQYQSSSKSSSSTQSTSSNTTSSSSSSSPLSTSSSINIGSLNVTKEDRDTLNQLSKDKIKSHELKILNFLIKKYLIKNQYSLTAISMSEEVEEDCQQWSELGLNAPEPPGILTMYRYFFDNGDSGVQGALSKAMNEMTKLNKELTETENNWRESKKKIQTLQKEKDELISKNKEFEKKIEDISRRGALLSPIRSSTTDLHSLNNNVTPLKKSLEFISTNQDTTTTTTSTTTTTTTKKNQIDTSTLSIMRQTYRNIIDKRRQTVAFRIVSNMDDESEISVRIAEEVEKIRTLDSDNESIVKIVANSLPFIVPGVLINKREELIPLILIVISNHPDETTRFSLTKLLFNLIKKPNEVQRHVIMRGCMALASIIGPHRTEVEILSQCWEQLSEKHPERRVLVADSCGCLAQFTNAELRLSLILSILQQLGEDKSSLVRESVAKNFSLLINFFDTNDKYNQIEESFKKLLYDTEIEVSIAARTHFLPSLVNWADLLEVLNSKLTNFLLSEMQILLNKYANQKEEFKIPEPDSIRIDSLILCLIDIIPRMHQSLISSSPFITEKDAKQIENESIRISIMPQQEVLKLQSQFEQFLLSSSSPSSISSWESLEWISNDFVSELIKLISLVPLSNSVLVSSFSKALNTFCKNFGIIFTKKVIKSAFYREFQKDTRFENTKKYRLLSCYTTGVLHTLESPELTTFLKDVIVQISMEEKGWGHSHILPLVKCIELLCGNVFDKKKEICDALCDLTANPSNQVRSCILNLFKVIIPVFKSEQISNSIIPSLITMSTDPDLTVRFVCMGALAISLNHVNDLSVVEKIGISIDKILEEKNHMVEIEFVKSITKIIPTMSLPKFRNFFILPRLLELARRNNHNPSNENRREMSLNLFDSVRVFGSLPNLTKELIQEQILPILQLLLNDSVLHDSSYKSMIQSMTNELESTFKDQSQQQRKPNNNGGGLLNKIETPNLSNLGLPKWKFLER
eukprot:gene4797-5982_t